MVEITAINLMKFDVLPDVIEMAANHVIDSDNIMAFFQKRIGEMTAQEPCNTGNKYFHRYYFI